MGQVAPVQLLAPKVGARLAPCAVLLYSVDPSLGFVERVQNSLLDAFDVAEDHKEDYFLYRDMLLDDQHLDIESLGPAFKARARVGAQ
eukprot:1161956-Pelagomonas_calceolata.AAC.12